jgi:hypothetical protein
LELRRARVAAITNLVHPKLKSYLSEGGNYGRPATLKLQRTSRRAIPTCVLRKFTEGGSSNLIWAKEEATGAWKDFIMKIPENQYQRYTYVTRTE